MSAEAQTQAPYIHKNKIRLDWAAQHAAHKAIGRKELAHHALLRASEKLLTAKGINLGPHPTNNKSSALKTEFKINFFIITSLIFIKISLQ